MKKMLISMLAMAAMVSCNSESDVIDEVNAAGDSKVEIKLSTGVSIQTKSALTTFNNTAVTLLREDIDKTTGTVDWSTGDIIKSDYTLTGTAITLDNIQKYFNNNAQLKSIFIGYAPTTGATRTGNSVAYTIDGEIDLLCTDATNVGTKDAQENAPKLTFKHVLSQVDLKIVGTENANTLFGTIKKIALVMPKEVVVSLNDATVSAKESAIDEEIIILDNTTENKSISQLATSETVGSKLVLPNYGTAEKALKIKLYTNNGTDKTINLDINNVTDNTNNGLIASRKHLITLTFNDNITITSEIGTITEGGNGSSDIEG